METTNQNVSQLKPVRAAIRLRIIRKKMKITLNELSEMSGFDQSTLSRIETGKREFKVKDLLIICEALGVSPGQLLDGKEGENGSNSTES